jgi:dolichol-phosphate mannosyltransferase
MKTITVISPCYNEESCVAKFYEALKAVLQTECAAYRHFILLVDDGSSDATLDRLNDLARQDPCVLVYSLSRNFGHQVALSAGLDQARGDAVILMDSDLQHPPALLPELIRQWEAGHEVVAAVRQATERVGWWKRLTSDGFYQVFNWLSEVAITPGVADFVLLARPAYRALQRMPERHRFLRGMIAWMGFRRALVPYRAAARVAGHSKYTLRRMLALAADALYSFTARPIRMAMRLGLVVAVPAAAYFVYILVHALILQDTIIGWPSTMCVILILGGLQLFFIGLIGEYLARVFDEVKARPRYLFKQRPRRRAPAPAAAPSPAGNHA